MGQTNWLRQVQVQCIQFERQKHPWLPAKAVTHRTGLQDLHLWWPSATTAPEPEGAPTCMQQRMCVQPPVCAVPKQG